jgi:hypothetical protein
MAHATNIPALDDLPTLEEVLAGIPRATKVTITITAANGVVVTYTDTGRGPAVPPGSAAGGAQGHPLESDRAVRIAEDRLKASTRTARKIYVWHQASYGGYQVLATTDLENPTRGAVRLTDAYDDVGEAFDVAEAIADATGIPLASKRKRQRR